MSLTAAMYSGISGLKCNAESLNVIGDNLANVNTIGFKSGRMLFSDLFPINVGNDSQIGRGTQIQKIDNVFGQGTFETTELASDIALQGNSFFALGKPGGDAVVASQAAAFLTRAGAFRVDDTYHLVNPDGYQVLDTAGAPIQFQKPAVPPVDGDFAKITKIDSSGAISYLDANGKTYYYNAAGAIGTDTLADGNARIAVINPPNPNGLDKIGGTLFVAGAKSGVPADAFAADANKANGTSERIYSNSLEQSNVDMATQFIDMIQTQRAYSANSKTITTSDEMTQEVINLKR